MAIEQDLFALLRSCSTALELRIHNWIPLIICVQHFSLRAVPLEQRPEEGCSTAAILRMVWSRRNRFKRYKFFQGFDQLIFVYLRFVRIGSRMASSDIPDRDRVVIGARNIELLIVEGSYC